MTTRQWVRFAMWWLMTGTFATVVLAQVVAR